MARDPENTLGAAKLHILNHLISNDEHTFNRSSLFRSVSSCGTHLSIFFTLPISERCRNIVVWSISTLVASSLVDTVGFASTNAFKLLFFTVILSLPRSSFWSEKSPDQNFSNQRCTLQSLIVFSPNAWFMLRAAFQHYCQVYTHTKKLYEYRWNSYRYKIQNK